MAPYPQVSEIQTMSKVIHTLRLSEGSSALNGLLAVLLVGGKEKRELVGRSESSGDPVGLLLVARVKGQEEKTY